MVIKWNSKKENEQVESQALCHILVVPSTWEVEVGGSLSEANPGKRTRPYLQNKLKSKKMKYILGHQ
jgi:hypothetical protein